MYFLDSRTEIMEDLKTTVVSTGLEFQLQPLLNDEIFWQVFIAIEGPLDLRGDMEQILQDCGVIVGGLQVA